MQCTILYQLPFVLLYTVVTYITYSTMVHSVLVLVLIIINVFWHSFKADAESTGTDLPPTNKNSSIGYRVYTQNHRKDPCFLEPNQEALKNCPINSACTTEFIIHGFEANLNLGNLFEVTKDVLLEREALNIIVVDWTKYNKPPYDTAVKNMYIVAGKVTELIKFLVENAGIQPENIKIYGHSLGAHMAGVIGKKLQNEKIGKIKRIDGLDPAGPYFETPLSDRLTHRDADFVLVMHTSNEPNGIGLYESIGHMDFFVNGGKIQPHCTYGNRFQKPSGDFAIVNDHFNFVSCNHEICLNYYIESINSTNCKFLGTKCNNYREFQEGKCTPQNSVVGEMGAYGPKIPGLPPYSSFYLRTGSESPYCLRYGFLP